MSRPTLRNHVLPALAALAILRAPAPAHAENSFFQVERRLVLVHETCGVHSELALFTTPDLVAATTVLGYRAAATLSLGLDVGLEIHGALGDTRSSLVPAAQEHYLGPMISYDLGGLTAQVQVARGLSPSSDKTVQVMLTREF